MIKVLFLTQTLDGGGAEKVLVNLVNNMDKNKFDITVETIFNGGVNADRLSSSVKYFCRKKKRFSGISRVYSFLPSKLLYKNIVGKEKYDIVVAYMHGLPTKIISGAPKGVKKIAWLHSGDMSKISLFKSFVDKNHAVRSMKKFDAIVGVAKTVTDNFSKCTGIKDKLYTCYNTNEFDLILEQSKVPVSIPELKRPLICSVGRFTSEKGFSRLIEITNKLNCDGFSNGLMIIGDGVLKNQIESETKSKEYNHVYFAGFQKNPYAFMNKADMFVCSSYNEGLSTATTEAVVLGLPCVSTNVSGAYEILTEESQGIVVENSDDDLYDGIKQMLIKLKNNDIDKEKIKNSADKFTVENTVGKVEELLLAVKES